MSSVILNGAVIGMVFNSLRRNSIKTHSLAIGFAGGGIGAYLLGSGVPGMGSDISAIFGGILGSYFVYHFLCL